MNAINGNFQPMLLNALREIALPCRVQKGTAIFAEGDAYRGPFFIQQGKCKVYTVNELGKELIINVFGCGDWMAAPPIFLPCAEEYYHASSEAMEDSEILALPAGSLRSFLLKNPELMFQFAGLVVRTTFAFQARLKAVTLLSVQERLEDFLRNLGASSGAVMLPFPKNQIASLLGTTPESVSRAIRNLMDEGKLRIQDETYALC